jgi:hypothetical protein
MDGFVPSLPAISLYFHVHPMLAKLNFMVCVAAFLLSKNQVPLAYFDFGVLAIIVLTYVFLLRPSMKTMAEKV